MKSTTHRKLGLFGATIAVLLQMYLSPVQADDKKQTVKNVQKAEKTTLLGTYAQCPSPLDRLAAAENKIYYDRTFTITSENVQQLYQEITAGNASYKDKTLLEYVIQGAKKTYESHIKGKTDARACYLGDRIGALLNSNVVRDVTVLQLKNKGVKGNLYVALGTLKQQLGYQDVLSSLNEGIRLNPPNVSGNQFATETTPDAQGNHQYAIAIINSVQFWRGYKEVESYSRGIDKLNLSVTNKVYYQNMMLKSSFYAARENKDDVTMRLVRNIAQSLNASYLSRSLTGSNPTQELDYHPVVAEHNIQKMIQTYDDGVKKAAR